MKNWNHYLSMAITSSALFTCTGTSVFAQTRPAASVTYFVVTAPTSPSNAFCLQNVMSFMDKGGKVGNINNDAAGDPSALNMPGLLRASDIIYTPVALQMWDATNAPIGTFATQNGKRLAWGLSWEQSATFLVSDIYFQIKSSDAANTLGYAGNLATNSATGLLQGFSSTLRGQVVDSAGKVTSDYHAGESILDHPVNRVLALVRVGYYATSMETVGLDLNYFKTQMPMLCSASFFTAGGMGVTNSISSRPCLTARISNGGQVVSLEGQRQLGLSYDIQMTMKLTAAGGPHWSTYATRLVDGSMCTNVNAGVNFFRGVEFPTSRALLKSRLSGPPASAPVSAVSNGQE